MGKHTLRWAGLQETRDAGTGMVVQGCWSTDARAGMLVRGWWRRASEGQMVVKCG